MEDEIDWSSSMHGRKENVYNILTGRPKGKRPLGIFIDISGEVILKLI
jgi:hypothetical protein